MKRKTIAALAGAAFAVGLVGCCSPKEAATVGAMIGRPFGNAIGVGVVAVEETFRTAGDVRDANPRFENEPRCRRPAPAPAQPATPSVARADGRHFYEVRAIVQTAGPAKIENITYRESEDVTAFWN